MKSHLSILCVVAVIVLGTYPAAAQQNILVDPTGKASLEAYETTFDFGYTPQRATITHTYWVKNTGTDSLFILNLTPD